MAVVYILLLGLLMQAARSFAPVQGLGASPGGTVLGGGFLLLTAYLAGAVFKSLGMPKLTGYLATGIIVGPYVLDLVSQRMLADLKIFNGVATALIALEAGSELDFREIRPLLKTIRWVAALGMGLAVMLTFAAFFLFKDLLPFLSDLPQPAFAAVAALLAITLAGQSPAVAVALRKDLEAEGPLVRTVLGLVVVGELVIVLAFTLSSAVAHAMLGGGTSLPAIAGQLAWEIPGSIVIGLLVGLVITPFMKLLTKEGALFVAATGFLVAEVGRRAHLDVLLLALAAGLFVRNFTPYGHRLHDDVEAASLPIFVTFFSVTGAGIQLPSILAILPAVLLFSAVRAAGFLGGCWAGASVAGAPAAVRKYVAFGLLPQGGLSLSLAVLVAEQFPQFGPQATALIFGLFAVNVLISPVLYRFAIVRSGEAFAKPDSDNQPLEDPYSAPASA